MKNWLPAAVALWTGAAAAVANNDASACSGISGGGLEIYVVEEIPRQTKELEALRSQFVQRLPGALRERFSASLVSTRLGFAWFADFPEAAGQENLPTCFWQATDLVNTNDGQFTANLSPELEAALVQQNSAETPPLQTLPLTVLRRSTALVAARQALQAANWSRDTSRKFLVIHTSQAPRLFQGSEPADDDIFSCSVAAPPQPATLARAAQQVGAQLVVLLQQRRGNDGRELAAWQRVAASLPPGMMSVSFYGSATAPMADVSSAADAVAQVVSKYACLTPQTAVTKTPAASSGEGVSAKQPACSPLDDLKAELVITQQVPYGDINAAVVPALTATTKSLTSTLKEVWGEVVWHDDFEAQLGDVNGSLLVPQNSTAAYHTRDGQLQRLAKDFAVDPDSFVTSQWAPLPRMTERSSGLVSAAALLGGDALWPPKRGGRRRFVVISALKPPRVASTAEFEVPSATEVGALLDKEDAWLLVAAERGVEEWTAWAGGMRRVFVADKRGKELAAVVLELVQQAACAAERQDSEAEGGGRDGEHGASTATKEAGPTDGGASAVDEKKCAKQLEQMDIDLVVSQQSTFTQAVWGKTLLPNLYQNFAAQLNEKGKTFHSLRTALAWHNDFAVEALERNPTIETCHYARKAGHPLQLLPSITDVPTARPRRWFDFLAAGLSGNGELATLQPPMDIQLDSFVWDTLIGQTWNTGASTGALSAARLLTDQDLGWGAQRTRVVLLHVSDPPRTALSSRTWQPDHACGAGTVPNAQTLRSLCAKTDAVIVVVVYRRTPGSGAENSWKQLAAKVGPRMHVIAYGPRADEPFARVGTDDDTVRRAVKEALCLKPQKGSDTDEKKENEDSTASTEQPPDTTAAAVLQWTDAAGRPVSVGHFGGYIPLAAQATAVPAPSPALRGKPLTPRPPQHAEGAASVRNTASATAATQSLKTAVERTTTITTASLQTSESSAVGTAAKSTTTTTTAVQTSAAGAVGAAAQSTTTTTTAVQTSEVIQMDAAAKSTTTTTTAVQTSEASEMGAAAQSTATNTTAFNSENGGYFAKANGSGRDRPGSSVMNKSGVSAASNFDGRSQSPVR